MSTIPENHQRSVSNNRMLITFSQVNQTILRLREDKARLLREVCTTIQEGLAYRFVWIGELNTTQQITTSAGSGLPGDGVEGHAETPPSLAALVERAVDAGASMLTDQVTLETGPGRPESHDVAICPLRHHGSWHLGAGRGRARRPQL